MKTKFGQDVIGKIAILKFDRKINQKDKKKIAEKLMRERKNIKTVLEKTEKVKGRLRKMKTKYLAGIKTKETIHTESGCKFKLNVDSCYFSPRLSGERLEIAEKIKKGKKVLVMFSGVGPYSVVIGKISKPNKLVSIELSRIANKYARENIKLNKLENIKLVQGDVSKVIKRGWEKFDYIVMPRPQLRESFLSSAFKVSKKATEIFYYGFGKDVGKIMARIYNESKEVRKKTKVVKVKKAGEIAPYKYRFRIDFKIV